MCFIGLLFPLVAYNKSQEDLFGYGIKYLFGDSMRGLFIDRMEYLFVDGMEDYIEYVNVGSVMC